MKIYFYHDSNILGGAETLVIRTVEWFCRMGYDSYIVSNEAEFYKSINKNLEILTFKEKFVLNSEDILITYPFYISKLNKRFELNGAKLILWMVHYHHLMNLYPKINRFQVRYPLFHAIVDKLIFRFNYNKLRNITIRLMQQQTLYFMDGGVKDYIVNYYNLQLLKNSYENIIQIPVLNSISPLAKQSHNENDKIIRVLFIGRLDRFKIFSMNIALADLKKYQGNHENIVLQISIIGGGEDKDLIDIPLGMSVQFVGKVEYKDLFDYITNNGDIIFAMGTTALESSLCYKPTILLDPMFRKFNFKYKYKFVFETKNYSLGDLIVDEKCVMGLHTIEDVMTSLVDNYNEIASKCAKYVIDNHLEDIVYSKFCQLMGIKVLNKVVK